MRNYLKILFVITIGPILGLYISSAQANNQPQTLRVAILDSPNMPPKVWTWLQYEKSYLRGLAIAQDISKKRNINIIHKTFFYGMNPLDVLNEIPKIKDWKPDVILGPHYSNQFLLLKNHFSNVLVLSSYASDQSIDKLPSNFYSVFPPDEVTINAMMKFIYQKYKTHNILVINRADCKDCNDMAVLITNIYKKVNPNVIIKQNNFIGESDNIKDLMPLLNNYELGDIIIILAANLYNYSELIVKLSATAKLQYKSPVFISIEDNWGNPSSGLPIANIKGSNYIAYLVNPIFFNPHSANFREFYEHYLDKYGDYPNETVSYVTFMTLMSAVDALNKYSASLSPRLSMQQKVLQSYQLALKNNPNWFRPNNYAVYQLNANSGKLVAKMDMTAYFDK